MSGRFGRDKVILIKQHVHTTSNEVSTLQIGTIGKRGIIVIVHTFPATLECGDELLIGGCLDVRVAVVFLVTSCIVVHGLFESLGNADVVHY